MKNISLILWLLVYVGVSFPVVAQHKHFKTSKELEAAFARDGYDIVKMVTYKGKRGIIAAHRTAVNYETKKPKRVFYIEGSGYEMGFLMGLLAPRDVERTAIDYYSKVLMSFIKKDVDPKKIPIIWGILRELMLEGANKIRPDIPDVYIEEMSGLVDGCKKANPDTKVSFDDILLLNVGFDGVLSTVYALNRSTDLELDPNTLQVPILCNAFSVFNKATSDGKHYFGRDFMFPTVGVFEHVACMTIQCPDDGRIPMVSVSAPGLVASVTTMNREGLGMGVDMLAGNNCNPDRPGLNSGILIRHATHEGYSAKHALDTIIKAQRGVTWLYFIADSKNNQAVVAECGLTTEDLKPLSYTPDEMKWLQILPDQAFLNRYENQKHQRGVTMRWHDYVYPQEFHKFNKDLFIYGEKKQDSKSWGERGYINLKHTDKNCPTAYYFAPQREKKEDVLLMTNHAIVPSMRLCGMNFWTELVTKNRYDGMQWRYDELNNQILKAYGNIDQAKAIELIDFLAPSRKFPDYYQKNYTSSDGKTKVIAGSVSLCNLTDKVIHTHFGFYKDQWISITLSNYVD